MQSVHSPKHPKLKGCLQILARGFVGIILLIVALAVVGYAYEHYASEQDMERYPPPGRRTKVNNHKLHLYCTGTGLSRPLIATIPEKMMPPAATPLYKSHPGSYEIVFQHKLWYASYAEAQAIETSDALVAAIASMGDTPLIVIRHGKPMFGSLSPQAAEEMEQKWQAYQEEIAGKSSAGRIMVAEASGHGIPVEQPAIIVEAVQQLLESP